MDTAQIDYIARLIVNGHIHKAVEFEAADDAAAWRIANEGVDPLQGAWVEVVRKPDPQTRMDL